MGSNWHWIKTQDADAVDWLLMTETKIDSSGSSLIKAAKGDFKRKKAQQMLEHTLKLKNSEFWCEKLERDREALETFLK